ncbi:MAG: ATP-binding protein [Bacteroidales bacterium]|nr:ATP-binding protein [Bacteroidales bacterium]MDZ4203873.1 ATP-binding protein [Bacteroidales bacterium]
MIKRSNPFLISGYQDPALFCNRESETHNLLNALRNGRHVLLISIRRLGKTALIHHVFYQIPDEEAICIYCDLQTTVERKDLINALATALWQSAPKQKAWGKQLIDMIKSLRPVITFNTLSGQPEVIITSANKEQEEASLIDLFRMLTGLNKQVFIALDEFQQIALYPETNTESLLRSIMQSLTDVTFIFAGSQQHLLTEMFGSAKKPFFGMTQYMQLNRISRDDYSAFILTHFNNQNIVLTNEALDYILEWTGRHTFYTQHLSNRLFGNAVSSSISLNDVKDACIQILNEYEPLFFSYRNMIPRQQWNFLKAIALEQPVFMPMAGRFIMDHALVSASAVSRSLEALLEKQMIYIDHNEEGKKFYAVYDVYFSRWLHQHS